MSNSYLFVKVANIYLILNIFPFLFQKSLTDRAFWKLSSTDISINMYFLKKNKGFILGVIALGVFKLLHWIPPLTEILYTGFIYKGIRYFYSILLSWIALPLIYIFFAIVLFMVIRHIYSSVKNINSRSTLSFLFNGAGYLIFIFYISWGFNYARVNVLEENGIIAENPDSNFLYEEILSTEETLHRLRRMLSKDENNPLGDEFLLSDYKDEIAKEQNQILNFLNSPTFSTPTIRSLKPKGILLRISTAGVYFPFALEGHLDDGLHPIEKPFVMAHELAHANAFTDEGECNFIGFITCINSDDPFVAYSGWFEYMRYLYTTLRRNDPDLLKSKGYELPTFYLTDYQSIIETLNQYPDIMPRFRNLFYDQYLKAQGVHSGMKSYAEILKLAYGYKKLKGAYELE